MPSHTSIRSGARTAMADQCLFFHRDYAGRSNDVVPVSMHSQSQRILEVEVREMQTFSDYNFALPDAGRQVSVKGLQSGSEFLHRPDRIWNRKSYDTNVHIQRTGHLHSKIILQSWSVRGNLSSWTFTPAFARALTAYLGIPHRVQPCCHAVCSSIRQVRELAKTARLSSPRNLTNRAFSADKHLHVASPCPWGCA